MTNKAAALVTQAKQWASHYGAYSNGEEGAAYTAPMRVRAAWDDNDADALAALFTDNGSLLLGDDQLKGREEIKTFMTQAFQGSFKGTRVTAEPLEVRMLTAESALAVTEGGLLREGSETPAPQDEFRAMWVLVKRDGDWQVVSYQTSPLNS